jgi:hypothetical protein
MAFTVPNMRLIAQDLNNACWYASAQMVIQWRRRSRQMSELGIMDPSEVPAAVAAHRANNGLLWSKMQLFAKLIGLKPLPLMSPTEGQLESWFQQYGPLWTDGVPVDANGRPAGTGHVVVLAGITRKGGQSKLLVYDPWPPNQGNVSWRPLSHLAGILSDGSVCRDYG